MRQIISSAIILIALASCGNKKKTPATVNIVDTPAVQTVVADAPQKVFYKSATYYTGRVDFFFEDEKGQLITVGISNMPEDSGAVYPPDLLEPTENLEGPPGENPAMVGKPFLLIKNAAGEVREIKPAK
jgi:hypothetical protein